MVNIKVEHKEQVRRFNLPVNASWIDLEGKLRTLFNIPKLTPFTLSYTDEDNDVITLSTDIELHEIFASHPTIKFNLKFSTSDDSSDSEDNDVWVLEGAASATTIETDMSGLQSNVSQKNIISTTNQEPQCIENDIDETSNQKNRVDDGFERVEKSPINVERVEMSPNNHVESIEKLPNDVERVEISPVERVEKSNDVEKEKSPNDIERVEKLPGDIERIEKLPNDIERVEKLPSGVERVEKLTDDVDKVVKSSTDLFVERSSTDLLVERLATDLFVERPSTDLPIERTSIDFDRIEEVDRVENSSNQKISRVNLLDDEFFESFNSFKISPTIAPFTIEPKPIPQPQPEVEDEQEDEETIGTLSSSNFSPFSERSQPQRQRQEDQNTDIEGLKEIIEQYAKKNPQLTASVIDELRPSIIVDNVDNERLDSYRRPTQPKEDKRNSYFRQHSITSPISGRSRSATPPRPVYNRPSTPPRSVYNRSSTPEYNRPSTPPRSEYNRSSTPEYNRSPSPEYNRSSTPPILPGSFPASTPCLWVNDNEEITPPRSESNPRRGRRGRGARGGKYKYKRSQRNAEQSTNVEGETQDREERIPEQYREDFQHLNEMGFARFEDRYIELLVHHNRDLNLVMDELIPLMN